MFLITAKIRGFNYYVKLYDSGEVYPYGLHYEYTFEGLKNNASHFSTRWEANLALSRIKSNIQLFIQDY